MTLKLALTYAEYGWAVMPLQPRGKLPLSEHGSLDASNDPDRIRGWWRSHPDANVGIATGLASCLLVVDLDGEQGARTWAQLEDEHGAADTLAARTGSGGRHLLYAVASPTRNSAKLLGDGVDTRGEGGYIVAPPSLHPNGRRYAWEVRRRPAPAPAWLLTQLEARERAPAPFRPVQTPSYGMTRYGRAALENLLAETMHAREGSRNDTLFRCALSAGRLAAAGHLSASDAEGLISAAGSGGLLLAEAERTFRSGFQIGTKYPVDVPVEGSGPLLPLRVRPERLLT